MINACYKIWGKHLQKFTMRRSSAVSDESLLLIVEDKQELQTNLDSMLSWLTTIKGYDRENALQKKGDAGCYSLHEALYGLIEKIQQATLQSMDNQRVNPSTRLQQQLDIASLSALLDRMNKRRMLDQEWISNSEQLDRDITELVAKSASFFKTEHEYDEQRFELSSIKERDMFLSHIYAKINRQEDRRMANQDAEVKSRIVDHESEQDLELFSLIHKASCSHKKYSDQRAVMRRRS